MIDLLMDNLLLEKVTLTYEDRTAYQLTLLDDYSHAYVFCDLFRAVNLNTTIRTLIAAMRTYRTIPKALVFDNAHTSRATCSLRFVSA